MKKREVSELKKRFKKEHATFSRMAGCYVNAEHEKLCTFNNQFLTLEDEEFYKYLEIASKTLSGTIGNNLLNLEFPISEEAPGGHQQFLMGLRESGLKSDELLDAYYDLVISHYEGAGNYLILLYLDAYDVVKKTSDSFDLDESEEVYTYLMSSICPVELSKPGLGYLENEKRIGSRVRDWVVGMPESGFLFPAFNDRSTDIHSALFYTKDPKNPHAELMQEVLGCNREHTQAEQKKTLHTIVKQVLGAEDPNTEEKLIDLQQNLKDYRDEYMEAYPEEEEIEIPLEPELLKKALVEVHVPEAEASKITKLSEETFGEKKPQVDAVIDKAAMKKNEIRVEMKALEEALDEKTREVESLKKETEDFDVVVKTKRTGVTPELREIDGQTFLLVPLDTDASVSVNGEAL